MTIRKSAEWVAKSDKQSRRVRREADRKAKSGAGRQAMHVARIVSKSGDKTYTHVYLRQTYRETGDRDGDDVIAIRRPPGTFDDDVDETPGDKFNGVDDPVELDWAASGAKARPGAR